LKRRWWSKVLKVLSWLQDETFSVFVVILIFFKLRR
jgi:hypothetical protein